jgi:hypothetical protein
MDPPVLARSRAHERDREEEAVRRVYAGHAESIRGDHASSTITILQESQRNIDSMAMAAEKGIARRSREATRYSRAVRTDPVFIEEIDEILTEYEDNRDMERKGWRQIMT